MSITHDRAQAPAAEQAVRQRSVEKYRRRAAGYDASCGPTWPIRERAVAALDLRHGERVLDVGCGTGLSIALLRAGVGAAGTVIGFDHSEAMLSQARARVHAAGWTNVTLLQCAAQDLGAALGDSLGGLLGGLLGGAPSDASGGALRASSAGSHGGLRGDSLRDSLEGARNGEPSATHDGAQLGGQGVDAILFHYTHDILRSPTALAHVLACARPGARVAIAGVKFFPPWLAPLNLWVYWKNAGYNGAPGELATPWDRIAPRLSDWRWSPTQLGMGYLASGRLREGAGTVGA